MAPNPQGRMPKRPRERSERLQLRRPKASNKLQANFDAVKKTEILKQSERKKERLLQFERKF